MTEHALALLRRYAMARQRAMVRVARACPVSLSAANKNADAVKPARAHGANGAVTRSNESRTLPRNEVADG